MKRHVLEEACPQYGVIDTMQYGYVKDILALTWCQSTLLSVKHPSLTIISTNSYIYIYI